MHQTHLERVVRLAPGAAQVTRSLAEADAAAERAAERRRAGLDAVLASLQAAKKVNVLDKSRADWSTFKQANTEARAPRAARACGSGLPCPGSLQDRHGVRCLVLLAPWHGHAERKGFHCKLLLAHTACQRVHVAEPKCLPTSPQTGVLEVM